MRVPPNRARQGACGLHAGCTGCTHEGARRVHAPLSLRYHRARYAGTQPEPLGHGRERKAKAGPATLVATHADQAQPCAWKQAVSGVARTRTSFKPGQSGNPLGRPRTSYEIQAVAREYGPRCIEILAQMAGLTDELPAAAEAVRLAALKELLDRGFGRATLPLSGDAASGPTSILIEWAPASTEPAHEPAAINGAAVAADFIVASDGESTH